MRIIIALVALVTLFAAGFTAARAADVQPQSLKSGSVNVTVTSDKNPFAGAYLGAELGGQFTALRVLGEDVAAGDGLTYGAKAGYNFSAGRFVFGPYVRGGFANLDIGDVLEMKDYIQLGGSVGYQLGEDSLISAHLGYEWQDWEALRHDIDASGLVFGGGLETMLSKGVTIGLNLDYVQLTDAKVQGVGDISRFTKESDAFRITAGVTFYPGADLPSLSSLRF